MHDIVASPKEVFVCMVCMHGVVVPLKEVYVYGMLAPPTEVFVCMVW
jgi:hypothetical protein